MNSVIGVLTALVAVTFALPQGASAKQFKNSYIQIEIPDDWSCSVENTEWICRSLDVNKQKVALVVLNAKQKGPEDNLESYKTYLAQSKLLDMGQKAAPSKVVKIGETSIHGQKWIEAVHLGSEVPTYYTHYLATVQGQLAVLVTLSARQTIYQQMAPVFMQITQSMKILSEAVASMENLNKPTIPATDTIEIPGPTVTPPASAPSRNALILIGLALILGAGLFFAWKKR